MWMGYSEIFYINALSSEQNGCHFADNILKCIFLKEIIVVPK